MSHPESKIIFLSYRHCRCYCRRLEQKMNAEHQISVCASGKGDEVPTRRSMRVFKIGHNVMSSCAFDSSRSVERVSFRTTHRCISRNLGRPRSRLCKSIMVVKFPEFSKYRSFCGRSKSFHKYYQLLRRQPTQPSNLATPSELETQA